MFHCEVYEIDCIIEAFNKKDKKMKIVSGNTDKI